ncbi:ribosomal protein S18 acetylase RimI-like enzyme [Catalinimonas alkaloidigena]|uniref:GNAT family N-acetyltransferase n=1 Tax=Catalinimonas alkaloidigena TaxID=1075417 RepID=UPI002406DF31|nr:GNAT family N-acetyltransferase [Catalinimonas alkaloidigena]MDF9797254.1 ribosomal protein S18 acetylase RimI-like enzyme [Catalinimonas alkaloidigena]
MDDDILQYTRLRELYEDEEKPFELLLLADEKREAIQQYIDSARIFVLEKDDIIIAVFVLQEITSLSIEIKNIAVAEAYQGKGIGKYLLSEAAKIAQEMGYEDMLIGTANGSIMQLYLYQKEGFEIVGIRKNFFTDNYPKPIYENGILCKHMIVLQKKLNT